MKDKIVKILLPVDFGDLGDYAYSLANKIAEHSGASIDVISIISGPQGAYYSSSGSLLNDEGNDYSEWTKKLETNKEKMSEWIVGKPLVANTYLTIGNVDDVILQYASDHEVDLIVMGTSGLFESVLWSNPSHGEFISNHSPVPVLTLKCDRSNINLDEIAFVGDFLVAKKMNLDIIKNIQSIFDSKLLLVKIKTKDSTRPYDQIIADIEAYAHANELINYDIHVYADGGVETGIGKFAAERDIDLIALGTHQSNGFSKLFRRSISDDVVNHLYHPVLTFPID